MVQQRSHTPWRRKFYCTGGKPKEFNFNLGSKLLADDRLRFEFCTVTNKRKHKKCIAMFELILESLIERKYIDLPGENLSDPNNSLLESTVQLKLYYTPPNIDQNINLVKSGTQGEVIDWRSIFDDQGRHAGHRYPHTYSKNDSRL